MGNPLGARKNGKFKAVSTSPSFNKTPMGNSTPPVPYPVYHDLSNSTGTVSNVNFNGDPVYVLNQTTQSKCVGDNPGTAKGVKSGTVNGEIKPTSSSSSVKVGKKPLVRQGDKCTLNSGNCPGVYVTEPAPAAPSAPKTKKSSSPDIHDVLDVLGFIPGLGAIPDLANAGIYAVQGNFAMAGLSVVAAVPGYGDAVKGGTMALKGGKKLVAKEVKQVEKKAVKEAEEKAAQEAAESAAKKTGPGDGAKVKGKKTGEKGKCGEWLAKQDMREKGFDEVVEIQNNSGHGVDLVGRNSKTGEVKVWEVKTTETDRAPGLSKSQGEMGGEDFTKDRLNKAANARGHYKNSPMARKNANKVKKWLEKAGDKITYEKREIFIDDIEKGCMKHPTRKSKSKPWLPKGQ